ncbi:hypothetical protein [Halomicrococcus gelatinilyticus]|uniref:hypothetical protein n=1 Tax=Halomicrococcus gelatinilyticus TaxID=1702103 RepID=UPI002E0EE1A5
MVQLELRELLEEKTGALLLIAGGFLSIQIGVTTFPDIVGFTAPASLPGWTSFIFSTGLLGFIGFGLPFVALAGLYYRLSSTTPRLAVVGGALMALTPILFASGLLTVFVRPLPDVPALLWFSPLPYIVGAGSFGLAFLWQKDSSRFVGIPLLVFSGTWMLTYTVGLKNGQLPGWMPFIELLAVSLVAMGYLLHTSPPSHDNGALAGS